MNIKIDNEYTLQSDDRNVILVRIREVQKGDNAGKIYEENISYHATVQGALKDYLRVKSNSSEATLIKELLKDIKEIKITINDALKGIDDII